LSIFGTIWTILDTLPPTPMVNQRAGAALYEGYEELMLWAAMINSD